jgi:hypothetical protein
MAQDKGSEVPQPQSDDFINELTEDVKNSGIVPKEEPYVKGEIIGEQDPSVYDPDALKKKIEDKVKLN